MSTNSARPEHPRGPRRHRVEFLEGRQLLSVLIPSDLPPRPLEVASASDVPRPLIAGAGERTALLAEFDAATQDRPPGLLPSPSNETLSGRGDIRSVAIAALDILPVLPAGAERSVDRASPFEGQATADGFPATSAFQAQADGIAFPAGWASLQSGSENAIAGPKVPPLFGFFGDPPLWFLSLRAEFRDSTSPPADPDEMLFNVDDTTSSESMFVGPTNDDPGFTWGVQDFAIGPIGVPGVARGLLSNPNSPTLRTPFGPLRLQWVAEADRPRYGSAEPESADAPSEVSAQVGPGSIDEAIGEEESAPPRGADLLASFSPFERLAIENAIDQFLNQVVDLGTVISGLEVKTNLLPNLVAGAGAIAALEFIRRRVRGGGDEEQEDTEGDGYPDAAGLPGLPRRGAMETL